MARLLIFLLFVLTISAAKAEIPILYVSDEDFQVDVYEEDSPVIVEFWASWCETCEMMSSDLRTVVGGLAMQLKILRIDIEENPITPRQLGVRSIPALIAFSDGKKKAVLTGYAPREKIRQWLGSFQPGTGVTRQGPGFSFRPVGNELLRKGPDKRAEVLKYGALDGVATVIRKSGDWYLVELTERGNWVDGKVEKLDTPERYTGWYYRTLIPESVRERFSQREKEQSIREATMAVLPPVPGLQSPVRSTQGSGDNKYRVTGVNPGGKLNVRQSPGTTHPVVDQLADDARGITLYLGKTIDSGYWVYIISGDIKGWVNSKYLAQDPDASSTKQPDSQRNTSLPVLSRLPSQLKGVWTSTPGVCREYKQKITDPAYLDLYPDVDKLIENRETFYLLTAGRVMFFDEVGTECRYDRITGNTERTRVEATCKNVVTPDTSSAMLEFVSDGDDITLDSYGGTLEQCVKLADLSKHFNSVWQLDSKTCTATAKHDEFDLVFSRGSNSTFSLILRERRKGALPDNPFSAVVFVDDIRLLQADVVIAPGLAVIPLGSFTDLSAPIANGMFLAVSTMEMTGPRTGAYQVPLLEIPLLGSGRAMRFLNECGMTGQRR